MIIYDCFKTDDEIFIKARSDKNVYIKDMSSNGYGNLCQSVEYPAALSSTRFFEETEIKINAI